MCANLLAQASAVLAKAHATNGSPDGSPIHNVFFSGGFVSANPAARAALARSLRALGTEVQTTIEPPPWPLA